MSEPYLSSPAEDSSPPDAITTPREKARPLRVRYAVTFEFLERPPLTLRGTVSGWSADTCVKLATREARKALKPVGWSSMVCVLLERLDAEPGGA